VKADRGDSCRLTADRRLPTAAKRPQTADGRRRNDFESYSKKNISLFLSTSFRRRSAVVRRRSKKIKNRQTDYFSLAVADSLRVVFASSNNSDQTGCLGGGGETYVLKRNVQHEGSIAGERVGVNRLQDD